MEQSFAPFQLVSIKQKTLWLKWCTLIEDGELSNYVVFISLFYGQILTF